MNFYEFMYTARNSPDYVFISKKDFDQGTNSSL